MSHWDEARFVDRVISLCLFRLRPDSRRREMITKARGRADALRPVSVSELQEKHKGANGLR
jgi:hypothetical protein